MRARIARRASGTLASRASPESGGLEEDGRAWWMADAWRVWAHASGVRREVVKNVVYESAPRPQDHSGKADAEGEKFKNWGAAESG